MVYRIRPSKGGRAVRRLRSHPCREARGRDRPVENLDLGDDTVHEVRGADSARGDLRGPDRSIRNVGSLYGLVLKVCRGNRTVKEAEIDIGFVDLDIDGQDLRMFGVHPPPPVTKSYAAMRADYFSIVKERAEDAESSIVVVGDFNAAAWSPIYQDLAAKMDLRSAAHGYGLDLTWKPFSVVPFLGLPIDHVLVSPEIEVVDFSVGDAAGSDHRPLSAELKLPESS